MSAGHSAADRAARYRLEAEQLDYVARMACEMFHRYAAAAATDARLIALLEPLADQSFHVLGNRMWPGANEAGVDFVLVGPTGVVVVDTQWWGDIRRDGDRIIHNGIDASDRIDYIHWLGGVTESAVAEVGVAPGEVRTVAVMMGARGLRATIGGVEVVSEEIAADYLLSRGARLRIDEVNSALDVLEHVFPEHAVHHRVAAVAAAAPPVISEEDIARALHSSILASPIEDWMAFLHPDQAKLARRSFNGPSRIRGAAGTGKTVVGLHRAAYLARTRPGKVLVTTLMRTLPMVLATHMERMAPDVAGRIEFTGIHAFAQELLASRGVAVTLNAAKADRAFDRAWTEVGERGILGQIDPSKDYWRDEVISVIKGRGLIQFEEYAQLARIGRRRALGTEARLAVWQLLCAYNLILREARVHDLCDVILLAEQSLLAQPLEGYSAVIADEAQDLSCAMIRMLHALVGDAPDGLNLIGDSQQTIYPGGYTLGEANVSIAGRGVVMSHNYRNTAEIAEMAAVIVEDDEFVDIEGTPSRADVPSEIVRHGVRPRVARFASRRGHDRSVVAQVRSLLAAGTRAGDIAVLTQDSVAAVEVMETLSAAGIRVVDLHLYDGRASSMVRVGTIKRAKGLEFKQVLVVRTPAHVFEPNGEREPAIVEHMNLDRRELYVAMTRARDGLWVGVA